MIAFAACTDDGDDKPTPPSTTVATRDPSQRYRVQIEVQSGPNKGPTMCVGPTVTLGDIPGCFGPPLTGFSWDAVDGEQAKDGYTWGNYTLTGTWDGTTFNVLNTSREVIGAPSEPGGFDPPCPVPDGGFPVVDASKNTWETRNATLDYVNRQMDHAGTWIFDSHTLVMTFTGDIARHRREIREIWGGPMCVARRRFLAGEIGRIAGELGRSPPAAVSPELYVLQTSGDPVRNCARVHVLIADAAAQQWLDARYPKGIVCLVGWLRPV